MLHVRGTAHDIEASHYKLVQGSTKDTMTKGRENCGACGTDAIAQIRGTRLPTLNDIECVVKGLERATSIARIMC